jgi:hypothetical protein
MARSHSDKPAVGQANYLQTIPRHQPRRRQGPCECTPGQGLVKAGEAIACNAREGGLDAATASRTIESEVDGCALHQPALRISGLNLSALRAEARRAPGGPPQG